MQLHSSYFDFSFRKIIFVFSFTSFSLLDNFTFALTEVTELHFDLTSLLLQSNVDCLCDVHFAHTVMITASHSSALMPTKPRMTTASPRATWSADNMLSYCETGTGSDHIRPDPTSQRCGTMQQRPPSGRQDEWFCPAHSYIGNSPCGPPTLRHGRYTSLAMSISPGCINHFQGSEDLPTQTAVLTHCVWNILPR